MQIQVVKSKIHRVKVTGADLNYIGSITIDEDLMDAAKKAQSFMTAPPGFEVGLDEWAAWSPPAPRAGRPRPLRCRPISWPPASR